MVRKVNGGGAMNALTAAMGGSNAIHSSSTSYTEGEGEEALL